VSDLKGIDGHQRVAAFLLSLDHERAIGILKTLDEDVVAKVAQSMLDLDPRLRDPSTLQGLYRELALSLNGPKTIRSYDVRRLSDVLSGTLGKERGGALVRRIQEKRLKSRPFLELEQHENAAIARVLKQESSSVAALVLSHLDPASAAEILRHYDKPAALEVVRRMATMTPPSAEVMATIAADLVDRVVQAVEDEGVSAPTDRLKSIAELLNYSDPDIEKQVLENLSAENAEMANALRERMFTWDDLASVDKRSMQKILGTVDTKTLSIALKACTPAVESNVMGNLSSRVRDMVSEERELAGPLPMSEVLGAREEVLRNVRALIEAGEFRPQRGGENLVS